MRLSAVLLLALAGCTSIGPAPVRSTQRSVAPAAEQREIAPPTASSYDSLIAHYAAENGVPLGLAHAVIKQESGYNPRATGRGTVGLMQIKPATARGIGYRGTAAGLYDPATNLQWGLRYLAEAYKLGKGDTCATALRYQGGHRATRMTDSTRRYCAELKATMAKSRQ